MDSSGTNEYIERVVHTYSSTLLKIAYAMLRSTSDAQDVVQEVFLKLITKHPQLKNDEHEKAWLIRVTVNLCKNVLKSSARKEQPFDEQAVCYENGTDLYNTVLSLPESYRCVIHLYYYEGYSIKEIAAILRLPVATVGTRLSRARKLLKGELEK